MFAGHFGIAAAVKIVTKNLPVWSLIVSTQLLDIVFLPLTFVGLETIGDPIAGGRGTVIHAEYSHSLLGAVLLSFLAGALARRLWGWKNGVIIGLVTFSHWIIDFIVHVPDLPVLPGNFGNLPYLGLGLWQSTEGSIVIEVILLIIGGLLYLVYTVQKMKKKWNIKYLLQGILMILFLALSLAIGL
nr:permease [Lysinibacillus timonensis]